MVNVSSILTTHLIIQIQIQLTMRKFTHNKLEIAIMIAYTTLVVTGLSSVIYHLIFNSPTITFGGW